MFYIRDLIRKKRNKEELTEEEIKFFVYSYNQDEILREQAAALLTLMYTNGLNEREMAYLSQAMAKTGQINEVYKISNKIVDIHPIGGMDDKITLLVLAMLKALNLPAFKSIGKEIGILDKIPGVKLTNFEVEDIKNSLNNKIVFTEEPENTAPVENKLYKLRNDIACNDDIALIALSLMCQKIALGARCILFDISYGEKAYVKTEKAAENLAKYLVKTGKNLARSVKCIITRFEEPIGKTFGNTIELEEIMEFAKGNMDEEIKEMFLEIGSNVLHMINESITTYQNKKRILSIIEDGKLQNALKEIIEENSIEIKKANNVIPVVSDREGYVESIDVSKIRTIALYINAIRHKKEDKIENGTGIEFCKKIGDKVKVGELLGYIHINDETQVQRAVQDLKEAYKISNSKVKRKSRVVEVI